MKPTLMITALFLTCVSCGAQAAESHILSTSTVFASQSKVEQGPVPVCLPGGPCIDTWSTLKLTFELAGCLDQLADVNYTMQERDGVLHVWVVGTQEHMSDSMVVRCKMGPLATRQITIPGLRTADTVRVHRMATARRPVATQIPVNPGYTCMAYWSGAEFSPLTNTCQQRGTSGCSNPFEFQTVEECNAAYGLE